MKQVYPEASTGFTKVKPTTIIGKIIQFPLVRLLIIPLFLIPSNFAHRGIEWFYENKLPSEYAELGLAIDATIGIIFMLASYWLYCYLIEKRKPAELSLTWALPEFLLGGLLGVLLLGLSTSIILLFSDFSIAAGTENALSLVVNVFFFSAPSLVEEILFRLILFRLTEEWLGSWPAVLIQALLFGFAHSGNPGATMWSSVSIMISAGALLAAVYMYTRRIWMVWGVHLFWNYFQSAVMGLPVSGRPGEGVLATTITGEDWITGGVFGVEASVFTVLICFIVGLFYFKMVIKANRVVLPSWKRKKLEATLS